MNESILQKPQIKVCGLTNPDDARCATEAGAQMLGFVVADWSPRGVLPSKVAEILQSLSDPPTTVLVTVGEEAKNLEKMAREAGGITSNSAAMNVPKNIPASFSSFEELGSRRCPPGNKGMVTGGQRLCSRPSFGTG